MSVVMRLRRGRQPSSGPADDPARWVGWRAQRLRAAAFPPAPARDSRVDPYALRELLPVLE